MPASVRSYALLWTIAATNPAVASDEGSYAAGGVAIGGDGANDGAFAAATAELGFRFTRVWWGFGGVAAGKSLGGHWGAGDTFTGTVASLRVGGEWHYHWLFLGAGLALAHEHVNDRPDLSYDGPALLMRAGIDIAVFDEQLRFRPSTEFLGGGQLATPAGMPKKDYECAGVYVALAYRW